MFWSTQALFTAYLGAMASSASITRSIPSTIVEAFSVVILASMGSILT